jgi:hypothetical protein
MVMIPNNPSSRDQVDVSFLYSLECNLSCTFCMYDCGPHRVIDAPMDIVEARRFVNTIVDSGNLEKVHCFGLYGGEPELHLDAYHRIARMLPPGPTRFTITNGSWSESLPRTMNFLNWAAQHNVKVFVSSTPEHIAHQNRTILEWAAESGCIVLKGPDQTIIPMGRGYVLGQKCTLRCEWDRRSRRLGILPNGNIMLQSCDGWYPIVGHIREGFPAIYERIQAGKINCKQLKAKIA